MPLEIIRNDITKVKADVIVNTANPEAQVGAGVDSAIYKAAGWEKLLAERKKIGRMEPGDVKATPAFDLDAKYIIHTVGPAWYGGGEGEAETVAKCYRNSLKLADELGAESIAFPLISTGTLGFPRNLALNTAISEISSFLFDSDMLVLLVVYNREAFELSGKLFSEVKSYIEESEVIVRDEASMHERRSRILSSPKCAAPMQNAPYTPYDETSEDETALDAMPELAPDMMTEPMPDIMTDRRTGMALDDTLFGEDGSIEHVIRKRSETFQQRLFRIIDRKGLDDVQVYKKANIDRKLFSKIKSNENYVPSKRTALAFAIALELNLDETLDLIGRAGYTFSPASIADRIIEYCITRKIYDTIQINCYLFEYDQPLLGGVS